MGVQMKARHIPSVLESHLKAASQKDNQKEFITVTPDSDDHTPSLSESLSHAHTQTQTPTHTTHTLLDTAQATRKKT